MRECLLKQPNWKNQPLPERFGISQCTWHRWSWIRRLCSSIHLEYNFSSGPEKSSRISNFEGAPLGSCLYPKVQVDYGNKGEERDVLKRRQHDLALT